MGYTSERNKGLQSLDAPFGKGNLSEQRWGNNILTRLGSQGLRGVFNDIPRGLIRMGQGVASDIAEVVKEPLGLGPEGWWNQPDLMTGEDTGKRARIYSDLIHPFGKSFANTVDTLGDITTIGPAVQGALNPDVDTSDLIAENFSQRMTEINQQPFNFVLETLGNLSIAGGVLGRAGTVGGAVGRGTLTGTQALRAGRPLAGRGVRATARADAQQAASSGSRSARASLFAEDIIGHPYRAAWNKVRDSRPAQLFRDPRPQQEVRSEAMANLRRFREEEGIINFRRGDPRRDWNELADEFNATAGRSGADPTRIQARQRLLDEAERLRARGIDPPEFSEMNRQAPRFDPNQYLDEPGALEIEKDFDWLSSEDTESFVDDVLSVARRDAQRPGSDWDLTPDSIQTKTHTDGATVYYVDKSGNIQGALEVSPLGINIGVAPELRGQGIGTRLGVESFRQGIDFENALGGTTMSEFGAGLVERLRKMAEAGELPERLPSEGQRTKPSPETPRTAESVGGRLDEIEDLHGAVMNRDPSDPLRQEFELLTDAENILGKDTPLTEVPEYDVGFFESSRGVSDEAIRSPSQRGTHIEDANELIREWHQRGGMWSPELHESMNRLIETSGVLSDKPIFRGLRRGGAQPGLPEGTSDLLNDVQVGETVNLPPQSFTTDDLLARDFARFGGDQGKIIEVSPGARTVHGGEAGFGNEFITSGDFRVVESTPDRLVLEPVSTQASTEAIRFRDLMREAFGESESGTISLGGRVHPAGQRPTGLLDVAGNELGHLRNRFFDSPLGQRFSPPQRSARNLIRSRNEAARSGEGEVANRAFEDMGDLRGRGVQGVNQALDARTTEAKFLRGIRNLGKRPEGAEFGRLLNDLDFGDSSVGTRVRDVSFGRRPIGANIPANRLASNILKVFEEAKKRAPTQEAITSEISRIIPGVDAESLSLLALNAIERANGMADGVLLNALGDYVTGDRFLLDTNRRAQALIRKAGDDPTPLRFRLSDEDLAVDLNALPAAHRNMFYEAARQRRITQRFMEETKAQAPDALFNTKSGTRIGMQADEATRFGVNEQYLDEVLGAFDHTLDDFGGDVEAAMSALDELQDEFFDVDVHTIRQGNATQAQKNRLARKQKEFEQAQRERTASLEELNRLQNKEHWTKRDWERHAQLRERSKRNLNQVMQTAARLGVLRGLVANSLEAAPVTGRNLLLYAREVVPEQIKTLEGMLEDGVGDTAAIQSVIDDLRGVPRTLDELNDAETYVSYLKDVRDVPRRTTSGGAGSATRGPALRRRGTALDASYVRDLRTRLGAQDMEFQRYYIARSVRQIAKERGLSRSGRDVLKSDEFGFTDEQIADMTAGEIQDALSHGGYRAYEPNTLFETRRAPQGDPLDSDWVREDVGEILTKNTPAPSGLEQWTQAIYDPLIRGWKVIALPLRPAWQVNNTFGNALFTMLRGRVSPFDYVSMMRASSRAVKQWNQGLARTLEIPLTKSHLAELEAKLPQMQGAQRARAQQMIDDGHITLDNTTLNEINSHGLIQGDLAFLNNSEFYRTMRPEQMGLLRKLGVRTGEPRAPRRLEELEGAGLFERTKQRARNIRATGREFVDYSYHINETVDNMHRTAIYMDRMMRGADHDAAISAVTKTLGDYSKLSPFERRVVRRVYPFWPWMRHVMETVGRSLTPDDIGRTIVFSHITNLFGEPNDYEELLPEWASGDIYMGEGDEGTPMFLSSRGMNPYLDVFDPLLQPNFRGVIRPIAPPIAMGIEQLSGVSQLTGRPFSSPITPANQQTPRPSLWEQSVRQVPQFKAGRDIYRDLTGQPLARYGTGEPALFPGAENDRSGWNSVRQLAGINIRPINVQQMRVQEKRRLFQEASERARQEARERAYSLENARSLPSPFGNG